ncbi:MAG: alpha/beta hydrolase [Prochloraceae cyanobacterium]|nr:alpha/beta hydrolase [Prochloraceae cyanobacterium]
MYLDIISIPPINGEPPKYLFVALHGWGSNASDLASLTPVLNLPQCQFIFPNAPLPHPHVEGGRAWYALETSDYEGLEESRETLFEWLESLETMTNVPLSRTILCGFSQGGAMILDVGLNLPLAGLCCLSGYLQFEPQPSESTFPPVLIAHGTQDEIVPLKAARQARDKLTAVGVAVEYQEFDMGHEVQPPVIALMHKFISARL